VKEETIDGRWWIHGGDAEPQVGTLNHGCDRGLSLMVKVPQKISFDRALGLGPFEETQQSNVPQVIVGRDAHDKPVTLFGCHNLPRISGGMKTYRIDVLAAVQGLEFQSWTQEAIRAIAMDIDLLHRWLGGKIIEKVELSDGPRCWKLPDEKDSTYDVCAGVKLTIARFIAPSSSQDEERWVPGHRIWLHFEKAQSLQQITDKWLPWIRRLFSLLIGTSVSSTRVECFLEDPYSECTEPPTEGVLLRPSGKRRIRVRDPSIYEMLAPYPELADQLQQIIRKWHEVSSRFEPVVDLFCTFVFHQSLYAEAEFLFLVQALEVFHARGFVSTVLPTEEHAQRVKAVVAGSPPDLKDWARRKLQGANYKPLDERISEIFTKHSAEAKQLFNEITGLPERIRYTRNHLTHYSGDTTSPKYLKGRELLEVNWKLEGFIWICLLKEIGVSGKPIDRLIRREANITIMTLD
jgi:hypothetical protein